MKIVVLGARGMLGQDLVAVGRAAGHNVTGFDLPELDIASSSAEFSALPACDWLVNCAAYTNVDGAETERETAFAVNDTGAGRLAAWCGAAGTRMLHVSTDYVFDGQSTTPYQEDDAVRPLNVYGHSKLAGERAVRRALDTHVIVRTQSLFGIHGRNFVSTISQRLQDTDAPLHVVSDQTSSPTFTGHLAEAILRLLHAGRYGTVHVSASGSCTWHAFACAVARAVKPGADIQAVSSEFYKRPAPRPAYTVLSKERYELWTAHTMPSWQEGLDAYLQKRQA